MQNGKYTDHELASARIGFEEVENYLLTSGSKSNIFVKGFAEIANIYKRSCEISATIGIATRGMNNREWVEYKKDNLKLFNTQQELNAKAVRALRDLELRTTEFINWNMGSLKQKDRERLAGVLKLYLSDEIAESQKKIQKSKDRSTVKLPVLAWSYLALDEYLNKNEWELVGDILERMKELNETMRDDK